ncbi:MAG: hypothetical protein PWR10_1618, partial [Halanaerobiales bacterium]|nr:hypothetical protein [Halanaerobiales bacterium]
YPCTDSKKYVTILNQGNNRDHAKFLLYYFGEEP